MKRALAAFLLVSLLPLSANAAIAFDNSATGKTSSAGTSLSFSMTTNSATMLVCGVQSDGAVGGDPTSVSVSYNSVALTPSVSHLNGGDYSSEWYLANPTTGANTVSISWTNTTWVTAGCVSFTGTGATIGATASGGGTGNISVSITTLAANSWIIDSVYQNNGALSMTAGSTQRYDTTTSPDGFRGWGQSAITTTAGGYTDAWTQGSGGANGWSAVVTEIEAAGGTPSVSVKVPDPIFWGWW